MASPQDFSTRDKLQAVEREIGQRRKVYPRLVASGKLTEPQAARQIALMEAIAADYRERAGAAQPDLFKGAAS